MDHSLLLSTYGAQFLPNQAIMTIIVIHIADLSHSEPELALHEVIYDDSMDTLKYNVAIF